MALVERAVVTMSLKVMSLANFIVSFGSGIVFGGLLTGDEKVGPAGRVLEVNTLDINTSSSLDVEEDRSEVGVVLVENLLAGELVPPSLTVTVQNTLSVDLDLVTTPLPEHDRVLNQLANIHCR